MPASAFNSIYRALVMDISDPESIKRIRVVIPQILGTTTSGWVWPAIPGGPIPALGDLVYVQFENGDPNNPVYLPSTAGGTSGALLATNNLSDLVSVSTAHTNLGLGSASLLASSAVLQTANNLSEVTPAAARTSLGLGTAATQASSVFLQVSNNLSDVTAATARTNLGLATSATQTRAGFWVPSDNGLLAAVCDPEVVQSSNTISAGVLVMVSMRMTDAGGTIGTAWYGVSGAGATLTSGQNLVGIYNSAGTLIGKSADLSTTWTSTGAKSTAITVQAGQSLAVAGGAIVYVGFLFNGTTSPTFLRAGTQNFMANLNLTAGSFRMANSGSAQTALPASVTLASTTSTSGIWAAVGV